MVRNTLMINSKLTFADQKPSRSAQIIKPNPKRFVGAKSILSAAVARAILIRRKEIKLALIGRTSQKNGVTHASAPPRFILKLHH